MAVDPNICSSQQAELESWTIDENGEVCKRVCDAETHRLLDGIVERTLKDPEHFNGTVLDGAAATDVPATADTDIVNILIHNLETKSDENIGVSFDGGANYKTVFAGDRFIWSMGSGSTLKQIKIIALDKDCDYEIVMNREAP